METQFKLSSVPMLISYICLSYYYDPEYFSKARADSFKISEDKLTIANIKNCSNYIHTIYCNRWINSMSNSIVKWVFHVNIVSKNDTDIDLECGIFFGLVSKESIDSTWRDFSNRREKPNYAICDSGLKYINEQRDQTVENNAFYQFYSNDIIEYTLNLQKAIFSYKINNGKELVIFDNIQKSQDINYKIVIQMPVKGDSVTLKKFSISY